MSNVVELASFNLKEGVSLSDFFLVSEKFNNGFLSVQKGYISRKLLVNEKTWLDLVIWETMEDAQNAVKEFCNNNLAHEYGSFMLEDDGELVHFSVEKSY